MNSLTISEIAGVEEPPRPYQTMPLLRLIERIARTGEPRALVEFHNHRTVFRARGGGPMLFVGFVDALRRGEIGHQWTRLQSNLLDYAYDLTIDKFNNVPGDHGNDEIERPAGPDCRKYFQAIWRSAQRVARSHDDPLRIETILARRIQRFVARHFMLSCLEARRHANPARSRYAWHVGSGVLYVWLPVWMRGRLRRDWLETNIDEADHTRSDEADRVQRLIDQRLGDLNTVPLTHNRSKTLADSKNLRFRIPCIVESVTVHGLATTVADEKADTIDQQRPAIRAMGPVPLRRLILRIFEDLSTSRYQEGKMARAFGLSTSTFSRFAGSRWQGSKTIPDLWANTACVLSQHRDFCDAIDDAHITSQLQFVADNALTECRR